MTDFWQRLTSIAPGETLQIGLDPDGVPVLLGRKEWAHILGGHPEMIDFRDLIVEALTAPVAIEPDRRAGVLRYYARVPEGRSISSRNLPLRVRVVVMYLYEQDGLKGYVSTAFLTR